MPRLKTVAHEAFARAYLRELSATGAARQVWPKMKPASLWAHASRLLRNVKVQRRIEELFESKQDRLDISVDRYDRELAAIAFVDPADVLEWDASGVHVRDWNKIGTLDRRAIQEISIDKTGAKRVKFHSKPAALAELAKRLGIYKQLPNPDGSIWVGLHRFPPPKNRQGSN